MNRSHLTPDKQAKMVLLKSSLTLRGVGLCAGPCAELEIEMFANPKLANTARSRTLRRLTLRGFKNFNFYFRKSFFPGNLGSIRWYFEKFRIFPNILKWLTLRGEELWAEWNSEQANTAQSRQLHFPKIQKWLTLSGVWLYAVLACSGFCQEQCCLCRPLLALNELNKFKNICELLQHSQTFFVSLLKS